MLFDQQEHALGTVRDMIGQAEHGRNSETPGEHRVAQLAPNPLKFKSGGRFHQASIAANVLVETRLHFGYWPISKVSGFYDEITGATITRHMEFDNLSMIEVEKNWSRINSVAELAVRPVITLRALDHWSADDPF